MNPDTCIHRCHRKNRWCKLTKKPCDKDCQLTKIDELFFVTGLTDKTHENTNNT
jgi:hypothetical protein